MPGTNQALVRIQGYVRFVPGMLSPGQCPLALEQKYALRSSTLDESPIIGYTCR